MSDLSLFRYSYPIEIRFADLDALEHVNHAKYFTYMETARIHYSRDVLGWHGRRSELGMIVAQALCDYKLPLVFGDEADCYLRTSRIGTKSFDFDYLIVRRIDHAIAAIGKTVQVAYDYQHNKSIPVPDKWREAIVNYEHTLEGQDRV